MTTHTMSAEQLEQFGNELDEIRNRVLADLGQKDADYIRTLTRQQRALAIAGRALIFAGAIPSPLSIPALSAGAVSLGVAKILDNMEIGHNVMHGQYDWMNDPVFHSRNYEWDTACPADHWRHSHNHMHHTWTNVHGLDRDIGYGVLRMDEQQRWHWRYLANPLNAFMLMSFFDVGVALHDLESDRIGKPGGPSAALTATRLKNIGRKIGKVFAKDYLLFPLLSGPFFLPVIAANFVANLIRNVWSFSIIFCGHFPDGVHTFQAEDCENESRGHWYFRQLLGSANIEGGKFFHVMSGNLSHQIEHHLFPDLPAHRYAEISEEVQEICERYGLQYNKGPLRRQLGTTWRKIFRLAVPERQPALAAA